MHFKKMILSCSASVKVYNKKKRVLPLTWIHALSNHGEFFLSSISFKALLVVNNFRNLEGLGTKQKLRTWEQESSQESASSLSAVGRREIGHFDRGSRRQNNKLDFISSTTSTVQCHEMPVHFAR